MMIDTCEIYIVNNHVTCEIINFISGGVIYKTLYFIILYDKYWFLSIYYICYTMGQWKYLKSMVIYLFMNILTGYT